MRPDMRYVVIERGRVGGLTKGRPMLPRDEDGLDALPRTTGIRDLARHHSRKSQTDVLGPLRRWLIKQVGRSWARVHAEFCAHADTTSVLGFHIKTHLLQYVDTHARVRADGVVVHGIPYGDHSECWVDPRTGLLRRTAQTPRMRHRAKTFGYAPIRVSATEQLHRQDGIWWAVTLAPWIDVGLVVKYRKRDGEPLTFEKVGVDALGTTYAEAGARYGWADVPTTVADRKGVGARYRETRGVPLQAIRRRTLGRREKRRYSIPD